MESILPLLRIRIFSKQADSPNVAMNRLHCYFAQVTGQSLLECERAIIGTSNGMGCFVKESCCIMLDISKLIPPNHDASLCRLPNTKHFLATIVHSHCLGNTDFSNSHIE